MTIVEPLPILPNSNVGNLLEARPTAPTGAPIGLGDWRIAIEMLLPQDPESRWGIARWGINRYSQLEWHDLTPYVRGLTWTRGTIELGARSDVGFAEMTLDNRTRAFSPWNGHSAFAGATALADGNDTDGYEVTPAYLGPGTVIRVSAWSPTGMYAPVTDPTALDPTHPDAFVPQFTGLVETWSDATDGRGADGWATVVFVEVTAALAKIDDNALANLVGLGDTLPERIQRLLDASNWHFGPIDTARYFGADGINVWGSATWGAGQWGLTSPPTLQSTNLSANRLAEVYLSADSVNAKLRATRSGGITIYDASPAPSGPERANLLRLSCADETAFVADIIADSVNVTADDFGIVNVVSIANRESTAQTVEDRSSIAQYGRRPFARFDLIGRSDVVARSVAQAMVDQRAHQTLRLASVGLHHRMRNAALAMIGLDLDDTIDVRLADIDGRTVLVPDATVAALEHSVTFHRYAANWSTQIAFGYSQPLLIDKDI